MFKQFIALTALFLVFTAGCSKQEEQPATQQSELQKDTGSQVTSSRMPSPRGEILNEKEREDSRHTRKRILTAEEQMRQYYAKQGLSEEEIELKLAQPYATSKPRRELPDQSASIRTQGAKNSKNMIQSNDVSESSTTLESSAQASMDTQKQTPQSTISSQETQDRSQDTSELALSTDSDVSEGEYESSQPDYSDSEPPELIAIRFDPVIAQPAQEITVNVQAVDNLSGVKSVFGILKSPSDTAMISFTCAIMQDDGTFQGTFLIPEHAESGQWRVKNIRLTDIVHNSQNYTTKHPIVAATSLTVESTDSDTTGPRVNAIYVDPVQATGGERIHVMVDAVDDKSGVARVYGVFASPSKNARLSFACAYEPELKVFDGSVDIPQDAESGNWILDYLRLEDTAKNPTTYYYKSHPDLLGKAQVEVYSKSSDGQPPLLENITVHPATVVYGETVQIIISAYDDISGIQHISGSLQSKSRQGKIPFHCTYVEADEEYVASIIIQEHTEVGLWYVENLILSDNARNQATYNRYSQERDISALLEQASFEVIGQ